MLHPLPGPEPAHSRWLFLHRLWHVELFTARGKKFGDVVDRVIFRPGVPAGLRLRRARGFSANSGTYALIFVLVAVMAVAEIVLLCLRAAAARPGRAEIFNQPPRHFFEEAGRHADLGHVCAITAPVVGPCQAKLVHGSGHPYLAEPPPLFHLPRTVEGTHGGEEPSPLP